MWELFITNIKAKENLGNEYRTEMKVSIGIFILSVAWVASLSIGVPEVASSKKSPRLGLAQRQSAEGFRWKEQGQYRYVVSALNYKSLVY